MATGFLVTKQGQKLLSLYLRKFKGKSSQKVYRSEISQFFAFYPGEPSQLSKRILIRYRDQLGREVRAKTIKRKFSILNQFFRFLEGRVKGFKSPIGKNYGDMLVFQARDYCESEAFKTQLDYWMETLIQDTTRKTYRNQVRLFFQWAGKDPKELNQQDFVKYRDHLIKEKRLKEREFKDEV